jgi:hypothetical protein
MGRSLALRLGLTGHCGSDGPCSIGTRHRRLPLDIPLTGRLSRTTSLPNLVFATGISMLQRQPTSVVLERPREIRLVSLSWADPEADA